MPTKVLPDAETFSDFRKKLMRRGFREISVTSFKNDFRRLSLKAPSQREGRESGFGFWENGLEVVVWTSFIKERGFARENDSGWVLIKDGDIPRYFKTLRRTKNFLRNLRWYAAIAQWRVKNRPLCPLCRKRMEIAFGKGMKSRFWRCRKNYFHQRNVRVSWDHGLPQAALDFLKVRRKQRARYRAKLRKEGKRIGTAIMRRRRWEIGRPENIVRSR